MTNVDRNLNVSITKLNEEQDNRVIEDLNKRLVLNRNEIRSMLGTMTYLEVLGNTVSSEDRYIGQISQNNMLLSAAIASLSNLTMYAYDETYLSYGKNYAMKYTYTKVF